VSENSACRIAKLQEERPEVLVDTIKIVVVDHGRRLHDPRIGRASTRAAAAHRPHDACFLLRLAGIQHAFALPELPQVLLCDVVLALTLLEGNEINAFGGNELLDVANERLGHRRHRCRRGKPLAPMNPQIAHHGPHRLQVWHINVEVHPVDRLVLKHHVVTQHVRRGSCYAHRGLRSSTGPRTHRASSSHNSGHVPEARPESTHIDRKSTVDGIRIHLVGLRRSLARF
jgi:hypothetical protein